MKTILLIGKNGQLGWELQHSLAPLGNVVALDRAQLDLTLAPSWIGHNEGLTGLCNTTLA